MEKSIFNFKILYENGDIVDLHDKDLWVSSFRIFSLSPNHIRETINGRHGSINLGSSLNKRKISTAISVEGYDPVDFDLIRDEIYSMFDPLKSFHIVRDLQPGKRMKVSVSSEFDIDYLTLEDGEFELELSIDSVFLESVGTTLDPFTFDSDLWQFGQGLTTEDLNYAHTTNIFNIYNAGNVNINPRYMELVIEYTGASSNLKIINETTGDEWSYNGSSNSGDVIKIDGIRSVKNELSIFRQTNKKLITLAPGWNGFRLSGTVGNFEIKFKFRYLYI